MKQPLWGVCEGEGVVRKCRGRVMAAEACGGCWGLLDNFLMRRSESLGPALTIKALEQGPHYSENTRRASGWSLDGPPQQRRFHQTINLFILHLLDSDLIVACKLYDNDPDIQMTITTSILYSTTFRVTMTVPRPCPTSKYYSIYARLQCA